MPGKPLLSLTTKDIDGATPTPLNRFTNKPAKDEVAGSKPKPTILTWNRPVMNLTVSDIPGNGHAYSHFLANATRHSDPLTPSYTLPAFRPTPTPEPKFLRDTLKWSDVEGTRPKDLYAKKVRDPIACTDIEGTAVGTTPRSKLKNEYSKRRPATSLDIQDIVGGKFVSNRNTNPLAPQYVMRCESSLGYMGRGAADYAKDLKSRTSSNPERPRPETVLGFAPVSSADRMEQTLAETGSALVSIGNVDRSKPGWRPKYSNKYYEYGVRMKDASLRSDDCDGTEQLPNSSLWTTTGGVWKKSARPRRGARNQIPVDDIDGAHPHLKKDSMHRSLGRQTDPGDPVYIPLDGIQKAGLLEREILSKTVNARKSIMTSGTIEPDHNAAKQLASGNRLGESVLSSAFRAADVRKTGSVSYPTFVQGLNYLGVAMPAKDAIALAKQLDPKGTGQVKYSELPVILNQALDKGAQLENEASARRLAHLEEPPKMATTGVPPMMKLKDKLYRKNERLYRSFGMFDLDKIGSVTTQQFADTIDKLNIGVSKEKATDLAQEVDFHKNGIITYFEFASKMDYTDDFARKEDKIGPPKTPPELRAQRSAPKTAEPNTGMGMKDLGDTALSIDLGASTAGLDVPVNAARQFSRAGSKAGSGRATPNLRPLDSKGAYQMLEAERAVQQQREELNNVASLPDGTPRLRA